MNIKTDLIAYDYSGYGLSEGKASEKEIYDDINQVALFITTELKIPNKQLILYI